MSPLRKRIQQLRATARDARSRDIDAWARMSLDEQVTLILDLHEAKLEHLMETSDRQERRHHHSLWYYLVRIGERLILWILLLLGFLGADQGSGLL